MKEALLFQAGEMQETKGRVEWQAEERAFVLNAISRYEGKMSARRRTFARTCERRAMPTQCGYRR